jgi:hypothetical protein
MLLAVILMVLTIAPISSAQRRYYRHHRPSKTKHIAVGTAIGAVGGALLGGKKGALIGAGAGAGTGLPGLPPQEAQTRPPLLIEGDK